MQLRWPQGFVCPRCGGRRARPSRGRGLLRCGQCDYQASVTEGTIFQDTRLPLRTWFRTMWWVTSQKNGVSALGLQSILGLGSYRTAWALLHKLRRAMVRPGRETAQRSRGGRRDLCGGRRRGTARTADAEKSTGSHRRRGRRRGDGKDPYEAHPPERPSNSCTASSKRLSSPTARSTPTAGKGTSAWRRLAIGTSTTFWPGSEPVGLRAVAPRSPGGCPVEALVDRDAPRRCEP